MAITARETHVKLGYKLTEVGVIPDEWEARSYSDICMKIQDGTHFSPKLGGNDYQYITSKNIRFGFLDISNADWIDAAQHKSIYQRCDVKYGDLLITKDGANTGNAALNDLDKEFSLLSSVAFLRFDSKRHVAGYFLQQILSTFGQQQIKAAMSGNAITRLTLEKIKKLQFPVPPFPEQIAIATTLSDMDALIASLEKLIAKKRALKQATMQQLLTGKRRLPGFNGEWEVKKLEDAVETILGGGTPSRAKAEYWEGNIPWATVKDFATFNPYFTQESITEAGLQNSASNLIKKGTIITSTRMALGKAVIYEVDVSINQDLKAIFLKKNISTLFAFYWFELNAKSIEDLGSGSTVKGVSLSDLRNMPFFKPPTKEEQTAIATVLSDMDAEIVALEQRREKTRALKQGMMQELLTGRIRLL